MTTQADKIRFLKTMHPDATPTAIAREVGCSRGAVYAALQAVPGRKGGRPRKGAGCPTCGGTGRITIIPGVIENATHQPTVPDTGDAREWATGLPERSIGVASFNGLVSFAQTVTKGDPVYVGSITPEQARELIPGIERAIAGAKAWRALLPPKNPVTFNYEDLL